MTPKTLKWFEYDQNNSGGSFVINDERGLGPRVYIQAHSHIEANAIAETKGIYFDGEGDCECCGNRWHEVYGDGEENLMLDYYDFSWYTKVFLHHYGDKLETLTAKESLTKGMLSESEFAKIRHK